MSERNETTAKAEIFVCATVYCQSCGNQLEVASISHDGGDVSYPNIDVRPCQTCLKEAYKDGVSDTEEKYE